ncbi:MAG: YgjP-like metallopeptidase domain-containing protein [Sterolibacterium sp.]
MKPRTSQLALRFDTAPPDPAAQWHDGASLPYLGEQLILRFDTDRMAATRDGNLLHLPLPPAATPRQIRDRAEAWLRHEAARLIGTSLERQTQRLNRPLPRWALSFSARSSWVVNPADGSLRFNWRLIEQPPALIEQTVGQALAALPVADATADLWEMQTA